mmetsp:Transcript_27925/g.61108  ORF Transcript_27925/g.61108 Transcript_27925/m.61108 type:complete len:200 (+) Transcript_27925:632-1231(+)
MHPVRYWPARSCSYPAQDLTSFASCLPTPRTRRWRSLLRTAGPAGSFAACALSSLVPTPLIHPQNDEGLLALSVTRLASKAPLPRHQSLPRHPSLPSGCSWARTVAALRAPSSSLVSPLLSFRPHACRGRTDSRRARPPIAHQLDQHCRPHIAPALQDGRPRPRGPEALLVLRDAARGLGWAACGGPGGRDRSTRQRAV